WEDGAFRTPLGDVPVDARFAAALLEASPLVGVDHTAHAGEHAVEVEVPFLQMRRPDVRIVPLVLAWDGWDGCRRLGEALAGVTERWSEPVLLLASSDLTHYEPARVAERKDRLALEAVAALDGEELLRRCRREGISMCGRAPTATVVAAARTLGAARADVVHYSHSGMVTGDDAAVVGYAGVLIPSPTWRLRSPGAPGSGSRDHHPAVAHNRGIVTRHHPGGTVVPDLRLRPPERSGRGDRPRR